MAETLLAPRRPKRRLSGPKTAPPVPCPLRRPPCASQGTWSQPRGNLVVRGSKPTGPAASWLPFAPNALRRGDGEGTSSAAGEEPSGSPLHSGQGSRATIFKSISCWALRPLNLSLGREVGAPAVRGRLVWGGQQGAWRMNQFIRFLRGIIWVAAGAGEKSQCPRPWVCPFTPANTGLRGRRSGPDPGPLLPRGP